MGLLEKALTAKSFVPMGITQEGKRLIVSDLIVDIQAEVRVIDGSVPPTTDGRFTYSRRLSPELLLQGLPADQAQTLSRRIHAIAEISDGPAGHEHIISANLSPDDALNIQAIAEEYNDIRRQAGFLEGQMRAVTRGY